VKEEEKEREEKGDEKRKRQRLLVINQMNQNFYCKMCCQIA
jgi:hypothetical protein